MRNFINCIICTLALIAVRSFGDSSNDDIFKSSVFKESYYECVMGEGSNSYIFYNDDVQIEILIPKDMKFSSRTRLKKYAYRKLIFLNEQVLSPVAKNYRFILNNREDFEQIARICNRSDYAQNIPPSVVKTDAVFFTFSSTDSVYVTEANSGLFLMLNALGINDINVDLKRRIRYEGNNVNEGLYRCLNEYFNIIINMSKGISEYDYEFITNSMTVER